MLGILISYSPFSQNRNPQGGITIPVITANLRRSTISGLPSLQILQGGAGVGFPADPRRPAEPFPIQRFNRSTKSVKSRIFNSQSVLFLPFPKSYPSQFDRVYTFFTIEFGIIKKFSIY